MARYVAGISGTGAGSTTLPQFSVYSSATVSFSLREVGIFATVATAQRLKLQRLASTGTQGAGQTEAEYDPDAPVASCAAFTTHTGAPTLGDDLGYRVSFPAAIGAAVVWTFGGTGIRTPIGTANGIGTIVATGTGQATDTYMVWDED